MHTYRIIGADQKEYGPVSEDQLRQWIRESRINANTRVRAEGEQDWRPLSSFSQFADLLGEKSEMAPPPAIAATSGAEESVALQAVKGPAIALLITAMINLLFGLYQFAMLLVSNGAEKYSRMPQFNDPQIQKILKLMYGPVGIASAVFELLIAVLILIGAFKMRMLKGYGLALTAAILAVVPCLTPCCFIGLPFGIWALVVLNKPGVKSQFH